MGDAGRSVSCGMLPCSPMPSVTHVPALMISQCAPPCTTRHIAVYGDSGGSGGPSTGGGGEGDGGGTCGGRATGVVDAQMRKPPYVTEPSANHVSGSPASMRTLDGPTDPEYAVPLMSTCCGSDANAGIGEAAAETAVGVPRHARPSKSR
jgi:hypothetical protein